MPGRGNVSLKQLARKVQPFLSKGRVIKETVRRALEFARLGGNKLALDLAELEMPGTPARIGVLGNRPDTRTARLGLYDLAAAKVKESVLVISEPVAVKPLAEPDKPAGFAGNLGKAEIAGERNDCHASQDSKKLSLRDLTALLGSLTLAMRMLKVISQLILLRNSWISA